jgi:integrase
VRAYISRRQAEKAANATINRELSALRRAFNVALADEKILRKPHFPMLAENNMRTGFIGVVEYLALHEALPAPLSHVLEFAFTYGWRKSEVLGLTWDRVDFQAGTVRLDPGTTKNREGRVVVLTDSLKVTFRKLWDDTRALAERKGVPIPWVFHRGGKPIRDMRGTWEKACTKVGLTGLKLHDLRRSAVRRMEQCGIPRSVAMKLTGHKTEAVYRRYAIVSEGDLADATRKLTGESVPVSIPGTVSGTVGRREGWSASERDE